MPDLDAVPSNSEHLPAEARRLANAVEFHANLNDEDWQQVLDALRASADEMERLRSALKQYGFAEHYGEPEGINNCERNPYADPVMEHDIPESHKGKECTCGADEQNAKVQAVLDGR